MGSSLPPSEGWGKFLKGFFNNIIFAFPAQPSPDFPAPVQPVLKQSSGLRRFVARKVQRSPRQWFGDGHSIGEGPSVTIIASFVDEGIYNDFMDSFCGQSSFNKHSKAFGGGVFWYPTLLIFF
jgi:hypothetical protein